VRVVHDPRCRDHRVPPGFPEVPARLAGIVSALEQDSRFEVAPASAAGETAALDAVYAVHEREYVDRLRRAVARGDGLIDSADNPLSPASFEAALAAVGCGLEALDHVVARSSPAFAAVRPPGHHAERSRAMGFCYFNNVAVVAQAALDRGAARRVAIVDVDVHHGNGTQHIFEEREDVLYVSLHQYPFYPGTGAASERGRGAGEGSTVNIPLAAGCGDDEWLDALVSRVLPELERYAPQLLLISAGFDAWRDDPLGGMRVSAAGFSRMGALLFGFAEECCEGRGLALLEGGYDVAALPGLVSRFLAGGLDGGDEGEAETRERG